MCYSNDSNETCLCKMRKKNIDLIILKKKKKALFEWDTKNSPVGKDGQCFNYICLTFI